MRFHRLLIVLVVSLLAAAVNTLPVQPIPDSTGKVLRFVDAGAAPITVPNNVAKVSQDWARDWNAKQLDQTVALYAPDAVFLPATGERVTGQAAIRILFKNTMDAHTANITLHSFSTGISGTLAYDSGNYTETLTNSAGARTNVRGNYLIVLRGQSGGGWLIVQHAWTGVPPVSK
jgi:uncharacterized protein (TIGR02246 family)